MRVLLHGEGKENCVQFYFLSQLNMGRVYFKGFRKLVLRNIFPTQFFCVYFLPISLFLFLFEIIVQYSTTKLLQSNN